MLLGLLPSLQLLFGAQVVQHAQVVEVGVRKGLLGSHALFRAQLQAGLHEGQRALGQLAQVPALEGLQHPQLGNGLPQHLGVLEQQLLLLLGQGPQGLLDAVQLVDVVVPGEEGLSVDEFAQDAADCPDVDCGPVPLSDQQLGGAVPAGGHILGQLVVAGGEGPGEPEVAELELVGRGEEDVLGLDVAVQHAVQVHEVQGPHQLVDYRPGELGLQAVGVVLQQVEQVLVKVLEDKVDPPLALEGLLELDHVLALKQPQHPHLPLDVFPDHFVLLRLLELLYRHLSVPDPGCRCPCAAPAARSRTPPRRSPSGCRTCSSLIIIDHHPSDLSLSLKFITILTQQHLLSSLATQT